MYQIKFTATARKHFEKIDKRYISAITKAFDKLAIDPHVGVPLVGKLKGLWKLRFSRYRIIYQIKDKLLIIFVLDIRHRKDVYRL